MRRMQESIDNSFAASLSLNDRVSDIEKANSYAAIATRNAQATAVTRPKTSAVIPAVNPAAQLTTSSSFRMDQRHNVKGINSGLAGTHYEAQRPPELSIHKAGSIDNIDSISVRSAMSGASGYQYQKHYRKKLDKQHTKKTRTITGSLISQLQRLEVLQNPIVSCSYTE